MSFSDERSYLSPVGMVHELEAHRRHADEICDFLLLDEPEGFARIPFGHDHHAATDDEAVEHDRNFAGHVEQGTLRRSAALGGGRPVLFKQAAEDDESRRIGICRRWYRAMRRERALAPAGRSRSEEDRRIIVGSNLGKAVATPPSRTVPERLLNRKIDGNAEDIAVRRIARRCAPRASRRR